MHKRAYYIINGITFYRLLSAPVLMVLIAYDHVGVFRWLLAFSFFTDMIDGWLARKYKVTSVFGARLDSISDDLTVLAGVIGLIVCDPLFIAAHSIALGILLFLFVLQITLAFIRYGKPSSFHTYAAKIAALMQGLFLILFFFIADMPSLLFYIAFAFTAADLLEEILLVLLLPQWRANIKGLFWLNRSAPNRP